MTGSRLKNAVLLLGLAFLTWLVGERVIHWLRDVPYYEGEPVPRLVEEAVVIGTGVRPDHDTIKAIGQDAVPFLIDWLDYKDPWYRQAWRDLWPDIPDSLKKQSWQPPVFDEREIRANAFELLGTLGPKAEPAVPKLKRMLREDSTERPRILNLLGKIGPGAAEALPALMGLLKRRNSKVIETLERIGPKAKRAVPELESFLEESNDTRTNIALARALYAIDGQTDKADAVLTDALDEGDAGTIRQALFALERLEERADDAMEIVLDHLSHEEPRVFRAAVGGLIRAGKLKTNVPVRKATEAIIERLAREKPDSGGMSPTSGAAVSSVPGGILTPYVLGLLAAEAEGAADEAVSVLKEIADNGRLDDNTRDHAVEALERLGVFDK